MTIWKLPLDQQNVSYMNDRCQNTMASYLGIEFVDIGPDYLVATMPVDHRTYQPMKIMHGGASCVLAETVGSTAANACVDLDRFYCVGLDINTNHIHPARSGSVVGMARPYHLGKSTQVWSIEIRNSENRLISVTRLTMAVLKKS